MKADTLVLGHIATLNDHEPFKEALACKDGRIIYVGSEETARRICDAHTRVLNYRDAYVYPGFADAHCHGGAAAIFLQVANLHEGHSIADYQAILKKYGDEHPDSEFIVGTGMSIGSDHPTHEVLDVVSSERPILAQTGDGHSILLNRVAMEKLKIDKSFAQNSTPDLVCVDANGEPTGWMNEGPAMALYSKITAADIEFCKAGLLKWQKKAFSLGLTAVADAFIAKDVLAAYTELVDEGMWHLRTYGAYNVARDADFVAEADKIAKIAKESRSEYFSILGAKMFLDGVIEQHTAWLSEPYADQPDNIGSPLVTDKESVVAMIKRLERHGLNAHFHAIGDGAVHFALDCIEEAQIATGNMMQRNEIAHIQLASPADVARMGDLNVVAIVAPLWMSKDPNYYDQTERYLGKRRTFFNYPFKSFLNHDAVLAFHSDFPVSQQLGTARSVYMACRRCDPANDIYYQLNPSECLNRLEALSGLTYGPLFAFRQETRQGRCEAGYLANLTVYDTDFFNDKIENVAAANLLATIVDGNEVYTA